MERNINNPEIKESLRQQAYVELNKKIEVIEEPITYECFLHEYMIPNKVCHLGRWVTDGWRSRLEWVTQKGQPNIAFLKSSFGSAKHCPVADCSTHMYDAHCKTEMDFDDYMQYFHDYIEKGHPKDCECLYLKDWHFTNVFPDYGAYHLPIFFESDWLNEFLDKHGWEQDKDCDDYRFVYIGPKGTWTPFHSDVLRSHSWSANICGKKLWKIFPPGEEAKLRDRFGYLPFDINSPELSDNMKYPNGVAEANCLEVVQSEGEVIFVPSGWHHQVLNLEDTISINHNWINGCNVDVAWQYLCSSLRDTQREISDCRDMEGWHQQCQMILKASAGVDYMGFYVFVAFIAQKRITTFNKLHEKDSDCSACCETKPQNSGKCQDRESLHNCACDKANSKECVKMNELCNAAGDNSIINASIKLKDRDIRPGSCSHIIFDIIQIYHVLDLMIKEDEFNLMVKENNEAFNRTVLPKVLIKDIEQFLCNDYYLGL